MNSVAAAFMHLDVIVPTYNRAALLPDLLKSLLVASVPDGLDVAITIVDNNSSDATAEVVNEWKPLFRGRLRYIFEPAQGRCLALNRGITSTAGDLVGIVDDDEQVVPEWFRIAHDTFSARCIDFLGGPYIPNWQENCFRPEWIPPDYPGVLGAVHNGDEIREYGDDFPGTLMGGNCVIRRRIFERIGLFDVALGQIGTSRLVGEDEDLYQRLLAAGARGVYNPAFAILHHIPPDRLTKRYFRRWCFWRAVAWALIHKKRRQPVTYVGGVPRYLYGRAARALVRLGAGLHRTSARRFSDELALWDLGGFMYGTYLYRSRARAN